jgi:hypothetical protein
VTRSSISSPANGIRTVKFGKDDRQIDLMRPYLEKAAAAGGVVAVVTAQEVQSTGGSVRPGRVCLTGWTRCRTGKTHLPPAQGVLAAEAGRR